MILDNRIYKLEQVKFAYVPGDYMHPWKFTDAEGYPTGIYSVQRQVGSNNPRRHPKQGSSDVRAV